MQKRNIELDYLKIIMSILVITIHIPIFSNPKMNLFILNGIARISMPTFLIINGYYLHGSLSNTIKLKKLIKRLLLLYLVWWIIYLPFSYNDINFATIINGSATHLWYLSHLVLAILFLFFLKKINISDKNIFIISVFLFACGYFIQSYRNLGYSFPIKGLSKISSVRNFLFLSFPYLFIGYSMNTPLQIWNKLLKYKWTIILLGVLLLLSEIIIFSMSNINFSQDLGIGCLFISPILFLHFKNKQKKEVADDFYSKLYIAIYLIQYLVIFFVKDIFRDISSTTMKFILVLFFTLLFSVNLIQLNRKINIFL